MQYDQNNKFIAEHHSLIKISKQLNCQPYHIKKVLNLNIPCKNGFLWKQHQFTINDNNFVCVKINGIIYPYYKVNKNGDIFNKYNKKLMFHKINNYYIVSLRKNKKQYSKSIHRIVYESFNPKIDLNKDNIINHLDENKLNNNLENLELVTNKQNITYSLGKKVAQLSDDGQIIKTFDSISEAEHYLKKKSGPAISKVCNGKRNKAYGSKWKFI
jgi:hypothetical protein